ncbi:hypothetical protein [Rhodothermus profundi]|uniref:Uncharacterized protein n=1 Tax=Rhodothermus profundi TaxID=633813 RepID=A0A1M6QID2_9BACT|nr:hypothetical protein [Rhodothermus profundi]SHK19992.1 hypothetical protein SAMN04488087_0636 [Rhodothermus profundi]
MIGRWWRRRAVSVSWESACQRAARGAAHLDRVDPGWYRRVDVARLELADSALCVLGQRYGTFFLGLSRAGLLNLSSAPLGNRSPVDYGFLCVQDVDETLQARDYALLNQAWRVEIYRRLRRDGLAAQHRAQFTGATHEREPNPAAHE